MEIDLARYGPWALIAGGSEGIGAAFAATLAANGFNLVLLARTGPTLERLAADLRRRHAIEIRTIVVDLTEVDAAVRVHDQVSELEIGLLVYNAGAVGPMRALHDTPIDQVLQVPYVNVIGQTAFAAVFGQAMRDRRRGGIILLSSVASASGVGRLATYAASKAYSQILAEGLWYELKPYDVDVLALVATTTNTPKLKQMGMPLGHRDYPSVEPEQVVDEAFGALGRGPVHYVDGSEPGARIIQQLPRAEAVTVVSQAMEQVIPPGSTTGPAQT